MICKHRSILLLSLFLIFLVGSIYPQKLNLLMTPNESNQFAFSFEKPFYDGDDKSSILTGSYQLYCNVPISSKFNILGIIPFINVGIDVNNIYYADDYNENGVGNIFIGLQTRPEFSDIGGSSISFGLFLPTADEDVSIYGALSNYYSIIRYIPNYLGIYSNFAFYKLSDDGLNYGIEIGPDILIPTEGEGNESELLIHYAAGAGFRKDIFELNAEFLGIGIVTDDDDDLNERLIHQFSIGTLLHFENVSPKLFYRFYINDNFEKIVDGVLGLGITVSFE